MRNGKKYNGSVVKWIGNALLKRTDAGSNPVGVTSRVDGYGKPVKVRVLLLEITWRKWQTLHSSHAWPDQVPPERGHQ